MSPDNKQEGIERQQPLIIRFAEEELLLEQQLQMENSILEKNNHQINEDDEIDQKYMDDPMIRK